MGRIRERAPGTRELIVSAGRDPSTGSDRRVIRTVKGLTKREAKAVLAELEVSVANGQIGADDPTFAVLLERWMDHLAGLGRADTTLYNYRKYIDREMNRRWCEPCWRRLRARSAVRAVRPHRRCDHLATGRDAGRPARRRE